MNKEYILAFESSCDDTSVAILDTDYKVYVNLISSQPQHLEFGGILPELASRLHMKNIMYLCQAALKEAGITLDQINAIAVSINPGLIGSLIVGLSYAKGLAYSLGLPLITVNHLLSHIFANFIDHPELSAPFLALVVSGGHTELVHFRTETEFEIVGKTLDDAAGETFDKCAKLLGLGFPGGPIIDRLAKTGNLAFVEFPRALKQKDNFNFSYSGLKTSVLTHLSQHDKAYIEQNREHLAASIQAAIVEPLVKKAVRWARQQSIKSIVVAGGVAANSELAKQMHLEAGKLGIKAYFPSLKLCMDNAAMVAAAAIPKYRKQIFSDWSINASSLKGTKEI